MKNFAAVFGLGPFQIYGIKRLRKKYKLIGFDKNKNAPGINYVNKFYNLEKINKYEIFKICKKKNIKKFYSFSTEFPIKLISYLNNKLSIRNPNEKAEFIATNKFLFRKELKKNRVITPFFKIIELDKIKKFKLSNKQTYICKPLNLSGSRGIFIFNKKKQLLKNIKKNNFYYQDQKKVLIEEFLKGQMFSIEGFFNKDNFFPICINKNFKELNYSLSNKSILINYKNKKILDNAKKLTEKCCKILGVKNALIHFEFIVQNNTKKLYPIEIALRGAGTHIYGNFLKRILEKNTADLEIELKENKNISEFKNDSEKQIYLYFISARNNLTFKKFNLRLLKEKFKIPFEVKILKKKNSIINLKNSADDRVAMIVFEFKNYTLFKKNYLRINRILEENNLIN